MINLKHIANSNADPQLPMFPPKTISTLVSFSTDAPIIASEKSPVIKRIRPNSAFLSRYISQQERLNEKIIERSNVNSVTSNENREDKLDLICE